MEKVTWPSKSSQLKGNLCSYLEGITKKQNKASFETNLPLMPSISMSRKAIDHNMVLHIWKLTISRYTFRIWSFLQFTIIRNRSTFGRELLRFTLFLWHSAQRISLFLSFVQQSTSVLIICIYTFRCKFTILSNPDWEEGMSRVSRLLAKINNMNKNIE